MIPPPLPAPNHDWALFLDVDGTLLEIAPTPDEVRVSDDLRRLLTSVAERASGALALVSGRTIRNVDQLFTPLRFALAGQHGLERRDAQGRTRYAPLDQSALVATREELMAFVACHEGLLLEDKGAALALHYRAAPELESLVQAQVHASCARIGPSFHVQAGKCVFELKSAAYNKGTAVRDFMHEAPFAGRTPVFIGDDLTDEYGFSAVNALGGYSICVGRTANTVARYHLGNVAHVLAWLEHAS